MATAIGVTSSKGISSSVDDERTVFVDLSGRPKEKVDRNREPSTGIKRSKGIS